MICIAKIPLISALHVRLGTHLGEQDVWVRIDAVC